MAPPALRRSPPKKRSHEFIAYNFRMPQWLARFKVNSSEDPKLQKRPRLKVRSIISVSPSKANLHHVDNARINASSPQKQIHYVKLP